MLRAYGIATSEGSAGRLRSMMQLKAAEEIGYPVVLKAVSDTLTHKSDIGAVALNLATPVELRAAYERMAGNLRDHTLDGMLVCQHGPRRA